MKVVIRVPDLHCGENCMWVPVIPDLHCGENCKWVPVRPTVWKWVSESLTYIVVKTAWSCGR